MVGLAVSTIVVAAGVPLLALAVDACWGEPSVRWHPVAWMGRALHALGSRVAPTRADTGVAWPFVLGALSWCALACVVVVAAWGVQWLACRLPAPLALVSLAVALKPMLAWRMLRDEVLAVEAALARSLAAARERLSSLVSRDVAGLDAAQVRGSALSSLAENLNDAVVAPLFWFALLGLPGAALYRFANTADAMWGYPGQRDGRYWRWAGKWAARADDVLSWLPARLTAGALVLAAHGRCRGSLAAEARKTPSPNGGWPMAALALALDVRLAKPGVYVLHPSGREPAAADVPAAVALAARSLRWLVPVLALLAAVVSWRGHPA
jgi:adenosylcobinamide-phosphate synthase